MRHGAARPAAARCGPLQLAAAARGSVRRGAAARGSHIDAHTLHSLPTNVARPHSLSLSYDSLTFHSDTLPRSHSRTENSHDHDYY